MQLKGGGPRLLALASITVALATGCPASRPDEAGSAAAPLSPAEQRERDSLYALGSWLARNLYGIKLAPQDMAPLAEGLSDALLGRPLRVDPVEVGERVQAFLNARRAALAADERSAGEAFVNAARQEPGAIGTVSGLIYRELAPGSGASPTLGDRVRLHYRGIRRDGSVFEDSRERGKPGEFGVTRVIPCWMEALQRMQPGGRARVTCISDLAYGDRGLAGRILPGAPIQFELELLEILPPAEAAKAAK